MSGYISKYAIHPGETLQEMLDGWSMSQKQLSLRTGLATKTINEIVKGKNPVSYDTAIKLSIVFGTTEAFWNNLQMNYDETRARLAMEEKVAMQVSFAKKITCYSELVKYGYVEATRDIKVKAMNLLRFLGMTDFNLLEVNYPVVYRRTKTENLSKENLAVFLRCGEIDYKEEYDSLPPFDKERLRNVVNQMRGLTVQSVSEYTAEFKRLLAECGVAIVYTPYLKNTHINGATRWLESGNPLIQITQRHKREDALLFTIFHELGHVLKHGKKMGYINLEAGQRNSLKEDDQRLESEADQFATNTLIPKKEWKVFFQKGDFSNTSIMDFAKRIDVSRSVVAGRLRYETGDYSKWGSLIGKVKMESV